VFTLFPFLGFMFAGGFIGSLYTIFYERNKLFFVLTLFSIGIFLITYSSPALHALFVKTDIQLLNDITRDNWFIKMGFVLCIYGVFVSAEPHMARLKTLNQIGQYTLTIYIVHFFLLYGSVFGTGIDDILFDKRSLPAEAAIPGALLFLVFVTWLSLKYHKWKEATF
jgi:surface polysaccharide O-acyltransferase-like enzyme